MPTMTSDPVEIHLYRLLTLKYALKLEIAGMHHSHGSVYAIVKKEFGFKGSKKRVLEQLIDHIDNMSKEIANA